MGVARVRVRECAARLLALDLFRKRPGGVLVRVRVRVRVRYRVGTRVRVRRPGGVLVRVRVGVRVRNRVRLGSGLGLGVGLEGLDVQGGGLRLLLGLPLTEVIVALEVVLL